MAAKRKNKAAVSLTSLLAALVILGVSWIGYQFFGDDPKPITPGTDVSVHFIDVGQGDCELIRVGDQSILIDAGENDKGNTVLDYLNKQGIEKIDLFIGTHPHSDHIGGMDTVINRIEVGEVLMPELPDSLVPTTKTYTDVLTAIADKNLPVTAAEPGQMYTFGDATLEILGPLRDYDDLNDMSVVAKLTYGSTTFLFGGDMEKEVEDDLLNANADVRADVLKLSHHGSKTSNSKAFLDAVGADTYAICVGAGNSYGHPHDQVLNRISGKQVYRTDLNGDIVIGTDGANLTVQTEK
ncbi:metallo-beta-lactamase domain protein [[Clostridium] methylpentosum DSM 5476]|uniref:Metallo-beta-lactamase domain protein n=1 Tax=[Clostridium] methylpentosum DSM 5476 TaxID=537013 RepID=C0EF31_9FIRM|nr:metallo-beta-lactamase domain protein [[Clostridium] methylpentosum DSM 5476]MDY3988546.1 MBL fold metallo-hydrolase [Massilioclostridium sp.]